MSFAKQLLGWYDQNARVLPWRLFPTAWRVWVSEIMLQQTRVDTVIPYFERFLMAFPDVQTLANANLEDVYRLWEGLGYYSRARNLHKAARKIVEEYNGEIPSSIQELMSLPGIGQYTAAAIASIAFNQAFAAVDGNIKRIYARILNLNELYASPPFENAINHFAQEVLPSDRPGDFNQALMDLGSAVCTPKQADCKHCPVQSYCLAYQNGSQNELPRKAKKAAVPHYQVCAAVIQVDGKVLLHQRPADALLGNLWEYPGGKFSAEDEDLEACLCREIKEKTGLSLRLEAKIGVFKHAYSHFKISVHAWYAEPIPPLLFTLPANLRWVLPEDLPDYPMGKVARRISDQISKHQI
jgi:A/G-specific adenine glycosylase